MILAENAITSTLPVSELQYKDNRLCIDCPAFA